MTGAGDLDGDVTLLDGFGDELHLLLADGDFVDGVVDATGRLDAKNFGDVGFDSHAVLPRCDPSRILTSSLPGRRDAAKVHFRLEETVAQPRAFSGTPA